MPHNMDIRKWAVAGLLLLHLGWIFNHMRWVVNDDINPWRLGGYAMYTVPNPATAFQVYDAAFPDMPVPANTKRYEAAERFTNPGRAFRCAPVLPAAMQAFFEENGNLIGRTVALVFTERRLHRHPRSVGREMQGVVDVTFQDERTFTYRSRFCGTERTETVTLPESALPEGSSAIMPDVPSTTLP